MKKRKDGRYPIKVTLPNGEVRFVYGRTQQEAKDKRDALRLEYAMGKTSVNKTVTVQEWVEKWWQAAKEGRTGHSSQRGYVASINNYINPIIGSIKLNDIRPIHIQNMINEMGRSGKSQSLQRQVLVTLNGAFKYAVRNGLLIGNPAQYAEYYQVDKKGRDALPSKQIVELLNACRDMRAELPIHLALYCGLRRGEIVALKWTDIDIENHAFQIQKAVEFISNRPNEKKPKSRAGVRVIPIPPHLWDMLQKQTKTSLFIVPSARNTQMSEQSFRRLFEPVQRKVSFHFTAHILRHTYATLLDRLGVSPKTCQYLLGHAELATTKDIYTHIQDEHIFQARQQIEDIFKHSQK